jgi:hypothetical protein
LTSAGSIPFGDGRAQPDDPIRIGAGEEPTDLRIGAPGGLIPEAHQGQDAGGAVDYAPSVDDADEQITRKQRRCAELRPDFGNEDLEPSLRDAFGRQAVVVWEGAGDSPKWLRHARHNDAAAATVQGVCWRVFAREMLEEDRRRHVDHGHQFSPGQAGGGWLPAPALWASREEWPEAE